MEFQGSVNEEEEAEGSSVKGTKIKENSAVHTTQTGLDRCPCSDSATHRSFGGGSAA